jgi:hypothetical protein
MQGQSLSILCSGATDNSRRRRSSCPPFACGIFDSTRTAKIYCETQVNINRAWRIIDGGKGNLGGICLVLASRFFRSTIPPVHFCTNRVIKDTRRKTHLSGQSGIGRSQDHALGIGRKEKFISIWVFCVLRGWDLRIWIAQFGQLDGCNSSVLFSWWHMGWRMFQRRLLNRLHQIPIFSNQNQNHIKNQKHNPIPVTLSDSL